MELRTASFRFHCGLCGCVIRKGDLCHSIGDDKLVCLLCPEKLQPDKERRLRLIGIREKK